MMATPKGEAQLRRVGIAYVEQRTNTTRSTIWRWYRAGRFPPPHYLGARRCWWLHEVEAWEAEQLARPAPAAVGQAVRP